MSVNINRITLAGNLTRDPEVKQLGEGRQVAQFTIAYNHRWRSADGQRKEETAFIDCEAWGRTAELLHQYLGKGQPCLVEGRLKQEQWQDHDGKRQQRLRVVAEQVHFLGQRSAAPSASAPRTTQRQRVHDGPSLEESLQTAGGYQA